ncbi:MAG: 5-formyltetrahydrofolate cyclo-ligase [Bauldia sp.]
MIAPTTDIPSKATLRAEAMARRDTLTTGVREAASVAIAHRVAQLPEMARARTIAAYMPIWSEVDPRPIIAWAFEHGADVVLPAVIGGTAMEFRRHRAGDALVAGRFGTMMPHADAEVVDPDVVVSPMVAFDRHGTRLGHGRGFYDRAIALLHAKGARPLLVGVAFAAQEVAAIPTEPHDVRMDIIVTERETLTFRKG